MRKLYEINEDIERVLDETYTMKIDDENAVDKATGEVFSVVEKLNALEIEKNEKIKSVAAYLDDTSAQLEHLQEKIKKLTAMKKTLENEVDGLQNYLLFATDNKGFKDDEIEVKVKESKRCDFTDETLIPEKFIKTEIKKSASKADITKAIKAGEEVPGAVLNTYYSVKVI